MSAPSRQRRSWTFRLAIAGVLGFPLGILMVALAVALGFGPGAPIGALLLLASTALLCFLALRWLGRRIFYGVGRRLLVSYLLVGAVPPLLLAGFVLVLLYVLAGQLAALRVEEALEERVQALQTWVETLDPERLEPGVLPELPPALTGTETGTGLAWQAGGRTGSAGSLALGDLPSSVVLREGPEVYMPAGFGRLADGTVVLFAVARGERGVALAAQAFEPEVRREVEESTGVAMSLPEADLEEGSGDVTINFDGRRMRSVTAAESPDGDVVVSEDLFSDTAAPPGGRGPLAATWVIWGRAVSLPWVKLPSLEPVAWDDDAAGAEDPAVDAGAAAEPGERRPEPLLVLVRTALAREYFALFGGLRATALDEDVGEGALVVIRVLLLVTLVACVLIALVAAVLVQRVAVATSRLSRGFEQVQRGDFDVRARLRGHDQLAGLIAGFNRMVAGLQQGISERAEREAIERELAVAHDLQHRLLPGAEASFPGFAVAAHFDPAAAVGGDLYQFWADDAGALRVVVGDVSGHGLATGIVMAAATALVWAQAREANDAGVLFAALDRQVRGITDARTFLTLQHCRLDVAARRAEVTNAGHPFPFRLTARGEVQTVESTSRPLGLTLPGGFSPVAAPLEPGDLWCFYTDGMVEAPGPGGEPFGFERLSAALAGCAARSAAAARERILAEWRAFVGDRVQDDDCTLVLVRVDGPAPGAGPTGAPPSPDAAAPASR